MRLCSAVGLCLEYRPFGAFRDARENTRSTRRVNESVFCLDPERGSVSIAPGLPLQNGYVESLSGKLLDQLFDEEIFEVALEADVLIEQRREHVNTLRPR